MSDKRKYFNFPIQLLDGFLVEDRAEGCLSKILRFAVYAHSLKLENGSALEKTKCTFKYFGISGDEATVLSEGKKLYEKYGSGNPMTGINTDMFWTIMNDISVKSDFEKACILAFLALKSIIGSKAYCKIDNKFLLARMDGQAKSCVINALSPQIARFANEYQVKKIKRTLADEWFLKTYSFHTRGFYVSFDLSLEDLIYEAEKKREKYKDAVRKQTINEAREKALLKLKNRSP